MNQATYVDIEGMSTTLEEILTTISTLEEHINTYNTDATESLGESSFKASVESNLEGIKNQYLTIIPKLKEMKTKIEEVKNEYNIRATKVENLSNN